MKGLSSNEQSPSLVAAFEALGNHTARHAKGSALRLWPSNKLANIIGTFIIVSKD